MYEKHVQRLLPFRKFVIRIISSLLIGVLAIVIALGIGMCGYHYYEKMSWVDAFANAAMILSGMGPLTPLVTYGGKMFAGFYALFSGLAFIIIIGVIIAPVVHRFLHSFHLDEKDVNKKTK